MDKYFLMEVKPEKILLFGTKYWHKQSKDSQSIYTDEVREFIGKTSWNS
ncbi:4681_t:CDS:2 [Dentiscutata heterogama]|uniref:4681_t:CDS:1 n=1 Tax=Dentiscutata heterogama TaxID=1316150 RepID=A0ACA9M639_9GLOM|nr:4681_t:CDS:2 [Dentiscutata heterogama]